MSQLPVNEAVLGVWQAIIDDNIPHTEEHIRVNNRVIIVTIVTDGIVQSGGSSRVVKGIM